MIAPDSRSTSRLPVSPGSLLASCRLVRRMRWQARPSCAAADAAGHKKRRM